MKEKQEKFICPHFPLCSGDVPSKIASLGWRATLAIAGWFVLGHTTQDGSGFFTSLTLYSIPILVEYLKFKPVDIWRFVIKILATILSGIYTLIGFLGMSNILIVNNVNNKAYIKVSSNYIIFPGRQITATAVWLLIGVSVILTIIEWVAHHSLMDKEYLKIQKAERSSNI